MGYGGMGTKWAVARLSPLAGRVRMQRARCCETRQPMVAYRSYLPLPFGEHKTLQALCIYPCH
jgi:hypothetical protein